MATPRQRNESRDDPLYVLQLRLKALENEHENRQLEYKQQYEYHGNKCVVSLQGSLRSLLEVIVFVRKTDKKLIDWHYHSDGIKTALRFIGLDRRTHAVIEKGTQKLQNKVQRVEKEFDQTGVVFNGGSQEAQRMKVGFLEFSTNGVDEVTQELSSARDKYGQKYDQADDVVRQHTAEHRDAQSGLDELTKSLEDTTLDCQNAEWSRIAWGLGAIAGIGVATISSWILPASLTASIMAAGVAAGRNALSSNEEMQNLEWQKRSLALDISEHGASMRATKARLSSSSRTRDAYSKAIAQVDQYHQKCQIFIMESQKSLNELYVVQVTLEKTRDKLRIISQELHECRYEETRRGIAIRLRSILAEIRSAPKRMSSANAIDFDKATKELMEIDDKTAEVLQIAKLSRRALVSQNS